MITINQGLANPVVLRLSENITISNPIFLFELTCVQSNQVFLFTAEDQSTTNRFNKFTIYEIGGSSEVIALTASIPQIKLEFGGSYLYKVYQTDNYDLQPTDIILDSGKALFINGEYQSFFFELGDDDQSGIFDEYEVGHVFTGDELNELGIFDPESILTESYYILTETGFAITTEDGDNLVWY